MSESNPRYGPPPVGRSGRPGRWRLSLPDGPRSLAGWSDALLVLATTVVVLLGSHGAGHVQRQAHALDLPAYVLLLTAVGGLAIRRVRPLTTLAITVGTTATYLALGYPFGPILFTMAIGIYTVAARAPVRRSASAGGLALLAVTLPLAFRGAADQTGHQLPWLLAWPAWLVLPWTVGTVVRLRREAADQARVELGRQLAYEERLRVAREVHDVVGHGLAVINMQAGVALHVLDRRPEQARLALEAVKATSKDALDELRTTLAVFRQPGGLGVGGGAAGGAGGGAGGRAGSGPATEEPSRRPIPGLAQLDALVDTMRTAGLAVDVLVDGGRADLPAVVDHAGYRIVQESLTNVLRHALPARATVRLAYRPGEVRLEITDDGRPQPAGPPGSGHQATVGHGIAGMRERAAAVGGELHAGPRPGRGFAVLARLPANPAPPDPAPRTDPRTDAGPGGPPRPGEPAEAAAPADPLARGRPL